MDKSKLQCYINCSILYNGEIVKLISLNNSITLACILDATDNFRVVGTETLEGIPWTINIGTTLSQITFRDHYINFPTRLLGAFIADLQLAIKGKE